MPTWAWIAVTLVAGLGSGLLGTFVKISHDRQVEVRRKAVEASQEFAAHAPQWFAALDVAIAARWGDSAVPPVESEPAYRAAVDTLGKARGSLNRLLVALPQRSTAAVKAISVVDCLDEGLEPLRVWPWSETSEAQETGDDPEGWSEEDEANFVAESEEELILEAKMWREFAEGALGEFIYESAGELRAGVAAAMRRLGHRVVHLSIAPQRMVKNRRREPAERVRRAVLEARLARLRERQAVTPEKPGRA
jgi:hypothetical protein